MHAARALARIPDQPACVEARAMLLNGRGSVIWSDDRALLVYSPADDLAAVVGPIEWQAIRPAIAELPPGVELVARQEDVREAGRAPDGWRGDPAVVHEEPLRPAPPAAPAHPVRAISAAELSALDHLPPDLRVELEQALLQTAVMAAYAGSVPVAFCYAGWEPNAGGTWRSTRWRPGGTAAMPPPRPAP